MRRHMLAWLAGFYFFSTDPTDHRSDAHAQVESDYITLENFADTPVGDLPRGWRWRKRNPWSASIISRAIYSLIWSRTGSKHPF